MVWLGGWLKEIIFVVLLAVFVDLLLPNRSFERYVKLVVSLLILLTLLSPLIKLVHGGTSKALETALIQSSDSMLASSADGGSTQQILKQGQVLQQKREKDSLQWAGDEIAREMKQQIESQNEVSVDKVEVSLGLLTPDDKEKDQLSSNSSFPTSSVDKPVIAKVIIYLAQVAVGSAAASPASRDPDSPLQQDNQDASVPAVKKIDIAVSSVIPVEAESDKSKQTTKKQGPMEQASEASKEKIVELLMKQWGIRRQQIQLVDTSEQAK